MEESQSEKSAVIVTCTEVPVSRRLLDLVKQVWRIEGIQVINVAAPERVFAPDEDANGRGPQRQHIEDILRDAPTRCIALVAHSGCTMNPGAYMKQMEMLRQSIDYLHAQYPDAKIGGVWIDDMGHPLKIEL